MLACIALVLSYARNAGRIIGCIERFHQPGTVTGHTFAFTSASRNSSYRTFAVGGAPKFAVP